MTQWRGRIGYQQVKTKIIIINWPNNNQPYIRKVEYGYPIPVLISRNQREKYKTDTMQLIMILCPKFWQLKRPRNWVIVNKWFEIVFMGDFHHGGRWWKKKQLKLGNCIFHKISSFTMNGIVACIFSVAYLYWKIWLKTFIFSYTVTYL